MRRARFGLLTALLALLVGAGAFLLGLSLFDDGSPDAPPTRDAGDEGATDDAAGSTSTSDGSTTTTAPGTPLDTPAWILVVASQGDEGSAEAIAAEVAEAGQPAGVLRSDDYPSMNAGFWVAYAGPYPDADAARTAAADLEEAGWSGVYVRCAGTVDECGGGDAAAPGDDGDDGEDAED